MNISKVVSKQDADFEKILQIIASAKERAIRKVNEELVKLYWNIGKILCEKSKIASYGDKYIDELASFIKRKQPELKGFNRRGLYRMKQFYEMYYNNQIVTTGDTIVLDKQSAHHVKLQDRYRTRILYQTCNKRKILKAGT